MLKVYYTLSVGIGSKFTKILTVETLPSIGSFIKAANHSFVVKEHEQDLDAYEDRDHEKGSFCNSIKASVNDVIYRGDNYEEIRTDLIKAGWKQTER